MSAALAISLQLSVRRLVRRAQLKRERARAARRMAEGLPPPDRSRMLAYADELDADARHLELQAGGSDPGASNRHDEG